MLIKILARELNARIGIYLTEKYIYDFNFQTSSVPEHSKGVTLIPVKPTSGLASLTLDHIPSSPPRAHSSSHGPVDPAPISPAPSFCSSWAAAGLFLPQGGSDQSTGPRGYRGRKIYPPCHHTSVWKLGDNQGTCTPELHKNHQAELTQRLDRRFLQVQLQNMPMSLAIKGPLGRWCGLLKRVRT